jgi:RNA-directed DNA polymerase
MVAQQRQLTFQWDRPSPPAGEASGQGRPVCQVAVASESRKPLGTITMEKVVQRENLQQALQRVCSNRGSPGIDGMTVDELKDHLKAHWPQTREQLLEGRYTPQPVRQVLIPKPGGGTRMLGIPTVLDRFIQQALLQVLSPVYDPTFSPNSYGFRPGRSAHQAVRQSKKYIAQGHDWVVDIDLEKCFDRINHDVLMGRLTKRISDKRFLRVIRRYLQAGIMVHGIVQERYEGTPQGGPLSPLLSNVLLDELDKELDRRGHKYCRYADDCNIYVKSERAGRRVLDSIERFLTQKLRLKINHSKTAVAKPQQRQFLGFSFTSGRELKIKLSTKAERSLHYHVKQLTRRSRGVSLEQVITDLNEYLRGWLGYFRLIETPSTLRDLDSWIRRRLRCFMMKRWINNCHTRYHALRALGVSDRNAAPIAGSHRGPWVLCHTQPVRVAMPNRFFADRGLLFLLTRYESKR